MGIEDSWAAKWIVVTGLLLLITFLVGGIYVIRQMISGIESLDKMYAELIISVLTAFQIELLNAVVKRFAIRLVDGKSSYRLTV